MDFDETFAVNAISPQLPSAKKKLTFCGILEFWSADVRINQVYQMFCTTMGKIYAKYLFVIENYDTSIFCLVRTWKYAGIKKKTEIYWKFVDIGL